MCSTIASNGLMGCAEHQAVRRGHNRRHIHHTRAELHTLDGYAMDGMLWMSTKLTSKDIYVVRFNGFEEKQWLGPKTCGLYIQCMDICDNPNI